MKKRLLAIMAMTVLLSLAFVVTASAETKTIVLKLGDPYMTVNGLKQEIDPGRGTKPLAIQGRTMVPIRTIIENMGGTIGWDGVLQQVTMTANNKTVRVTIGYNKAEIKAQAGGENWTQKTLDVAPQTINGRTMVPLRFVTEELGATVGWDGKTQTVTLTFGVAQFDPLNWTGTWETDDGIVVLNHSGTNVATVTDCERWGRITGTISGKALTGKWYVDYGNQGEILLTISEDGKSYTGKYNYSSATNPFEPNPDDPEDGWYQTSGIRQ